MMAPLFFEFFHLKWLDIPEPILNDQGDILSSSELASTQVTEFLRIYLIFVYENLNVATEKQILFR